LIKETEAILETEKKKLEAKQNKTQEEREALVDVNITYKLTGGGKDSWKDVPILLADDRQRYTKSVKKQDKNTIESQAKQLQQERTHFELQIKEKDKELVSLKNDNQSLQRGNSTVQQDMKTKDSKINSLQSENQELKLKIISFQTESQSLKHRVDECDQQVKASDNKINLLESEKREYRATTIQQAQTLSTLEQEKQALEQDKRNTIIEMERLKSSYTILEQLLKSKEDVILSLNRENQTLSTANQGNQQGANDMVDTLKDLLKGKNNEIDLLKQNTEHLLANEQRRNDVLEQEIRALKQERTQQQAIVQNTGPSNINSTNSNPTQPEQHDDSYNDLNYESEYSDTEESDGDDINYDTPSEDEDSNNDLNYDDVNESNK
jgi:chromosome segregation ATPase